MSAGAAREVRELIAALGLVRKVDLLAVVKKVGQWTRSTQAQQQQQQRQQAGKNAALYSLLIESVAVHRLVLRLVQTPAWPLLARPVSFRAGSKGFRRCQGTAPPPAALKLATAPAACLAWRPN